MSPFKQARGDREKEKHIYNRKKPLVIYTIY